MKLKTTNLLVLFLATISIFLSSCAAIGDIFKAGMWTSVILIVIVVLIVIWIINKVRK